MKKITKSILNWLPVITLGIILGSFLQLTQAWEEPGSNPPNSNIGAPVTTGSASQYKSGALGVEGLIRGYGKVMGDELCFGWDCRSDWQDLYKSGDNICIESGGCVDVADNYIGDSGTHYAGGTLNMRRNDITNVDDVRLNDIYKNGWGDIDFYDDVDMKGNEITGLDMPTKGDEVANKDYVDAQSGGGGDGSAFLCYATCGDCGGGYTEAIDYGNPEEKGGVAVSGGMGWPLIFECGEGGMGAKRFEYCKVKVTDGGSAKTTSEAEKEVGADGFGDCKVCCQ